jgi:hypothetical protein
MSVIVMSNVAKLPRDGHNNRELHHEWNKMKTTRRKKESKEAAKANMIFQSSNA